MMVWLMVMNPAWLAPIAAVAKIDSALLSDHARSMGPSPLVKAKNKNSLPLADSLRTPAKKMDVSSAPPPTPAIKALTPTDPAPNLSSEMAGKMDS